jgi:hypothetical protein
MEFGTFVDKIMFGWLFLVYVIVTSSRTKELYLICESEVCYEHSVQTYSGSMDAVEKNFISKQFLSKCVILTRVT